MTGTTNLNARRRGPLAAQALLGLVGGGALAFPGSVLGTWVATQTALADSAPVGGVLGLLAACPLGIALGVWLGGRLTAHRAPLWAALLGAYLGAWAPLLPLALGLRTEARLLWVVIALISLALALIIHSRVARHSGRTEHRS